MPDIVWFVLVGLLALVCLGWSWVDANSGRR
jgi:hypothetical protein